MLSLMLLNLQVGYFLEISGHVLIIFWYVGDLYQKIDLFLFHG